MIYLLIFLVFGPAGLLLALVIPALRVVLWGLIKLYALLLIIIIFLLLANG